MKALFTLLAPWLLALAATAASGQEKPNLLILGSAHLANPGHDAVNLSVEDVLSPRRQAEISALVATLARYQPTHIAIEFPQAYQSKLDERYQSYLHGMYELSRTEADQLGLRLAKQLGHSQVYAIDWNGNPPGDVEADYDWEKYAQDNGQQDLLATVVNPQRARSFMIELKQQNMTTWYQQINEPAALLQSHQVYFDIAMIGSGDRQIGANWVGTWYGRNLRIFKNITALAQTPTARILVIYGQGHAYLLNQFAEESQRFRLTRPAMVLAADRAGAR